MVAVEKLTKGIDKYMRSTLFLLYNGGEPRTIVHTGYILQRG